VIRTCPPYLTTAAATANTATAAAAAITTTLTTFSFYVHGSVHRMNIVIYIQQDATLHRLFYLDTALHVSVGPPPVMLIAAGSGNGVTNTRCCRYSCLRS
jgi:hypothetical protein